MSTKRTQQSMLSEKSVAKKPLTDKPKSTEALRKILKKKYGK